MSQPIFNSRPSLMDRAQFLNAFGGIYEHAQWVAETLWEEGVTDDDDTVEHLAARLRACVDKSGKPRQLELLRAHPELVGKLKAAETLTKHSAEEQTGAGLDQCSAEEIELFTGYNTLYGERFGHPFIIAVRGLGRRDILDAFERRLENDAESEFLTALEEVHKIAGLRLDLLAG